MSRNISLIITDEVRKNWILPLRKTFQAWEKLITETRNLSENICPLTKISKHFYVFLV
jgi:hypothetical protein